MKKTKEEKSEEKNLEEMKYLTGFKSYAGIISFVSILGMILSLIGVFCPICSYNPTSIDELKQTVSFFDLSFVATIGLLFLVVAFAMAVYVVSTLSKKDWRNHTKRYTVCAVLAVLFVLASVVCLTVACVFYRIPQKELDYLETKEEAGYYLFLIGGVLFSVTFLIYCFVLKNIARGKIQLEQIAVGKKMQNEKSNIAENTLSEKLTELQKMKEEGLITDEEYKYKKEELLKNYK